MQQVYSLWDLMVNRDVRYSSVTNTAALSKNTYSQHVRMLEETINNTQANCVDGSVLFASMLRRLESIPLWLSPKSIATLRFGPMRSMNIFTA